MSNVETRVAVSSMVAGLTNGTERLGLPREMIAFRWLNFDPSTIGVHAALLPDMRSLAGLLWYPGTPFPEKLKRLGTAILMRSVVQTIQEVGTRNQDTYVVLHPEPAAYVLKRITEEKLVIPNNVALAVENDEHILRGYHLPKTLDPRHPATVKRLADELTQQGVNTKIVLDVDHLRSSYPDMTIADAIQFLGGRPDVLHISGENHNGHSAERALQFIAEAGYPNLVVFEGPVSASPMWIMPDELRDRRALFQEIQTRLRELNSTPH